ncbi:MAG: ATP synthase F1 subunit epsilon [Armatimonadota bacterium]
MADVTFLLEIITPERLKFKGAVCGITLYMEDGQICVLAHHAPLMGMVISGELFVRTEFKIMHFAIGDGFLQVRENKATLLVDFAERAEEIDYEEVLREKERIEHELSAAREKPDLNTDTLEIQLKQEIVKLNLAKKNI